MKLHLPFFGLIVAFPCLYGSGAVLQSSLGSILGLLLVAGICLCLLWSTSQE